ncbi:MAG: NAD(P)H-dependent oxidoreductase [Myxococcaceae bacterium]|nr:NAD(P)H-dependent oxidoreductase [Myxococcaceae bacterium]
MPFTVLDVQAMPRGERSRTRKVHDAFFRGLKASRPDAHIIAKDLAHHHDSLPAFDEWDVEAKFEVMYGEGKLDEVGARRWNALTALTDELHAANLVVVSAPMWNFGIPWFLKRWLDAVVQGRLTFEYVNGGYQGLLKGRSAVVLTSRDGDYRPGSPFASYDYHLPYLRMILGFMGLDPIHAVAAEPMVAGGPEAAARGLETAIAEAEKLGRSL